MFCKEKTQAELLEAESRSFEERRAQHEQECSARIAWCLQQGMTPACDYVHLAPGNDANFMFGVPPWLPDGSINREGVPYAHPRDCVLDKSRQLPDYTYKKPSSAPSTSARVAAKQTPSQKKLAAASKGCMRLDVAWDRKQLGQQ